MRSVYGKECAKHPELAGRRYLPSNTCIECQRELNREGNKRRKLENEARDQRLAKCEALLGRSCYWVRAIDPGLYNEIIEVLGHGIQSST